MNISKNINYIFIVIGAILSIYAEKQKPENQFLLIAGIVLLMIGIYRISKHIPSKKDDDAETGTNAQNDN